MRGFLQQRPALKVGLAIAGGIIIGEWVDLPLGSIIVGFSVCLILSLLLFFLSRSFPSIATAQSALLLGVLVLLGAWKFTLDKKAVTDNSISTLVDEETEVQVRGIVLDRPREKTRTDQLVMRARLLSTEKSTHAMDGDLLIYVSRKKGNGKSGSNVTIGSEIAATGKIARPPAPRNPGDFDFGQYLLLHDISAVMFVASWDDVSMISNETNAWSPRVVISHIRGSIATRIERQVGGVEASFLKGILLGDRSEIPLEVKTSFINSGVVHILAVSGLHVGMLVLIFMSVFTVLRAGRVATILFTVASLLFYMLLTGSSPSVVRATIMAIVILLAPLIQRKSDLFNSLGVAAVIIFIIDAKQLFNPGFQLSFAAVASILYFYPRIAGLSTRLPERFRMSKPFDMVFKLFSVSFAAQIGTLPFTVAYFGKVSLVAFIANLFVIPAVGIALALGFAVAFFSLFSGWIAGIYGAGEQWLLSSILKLIAFSGNLSFAYVELPKPDLIAVLIFYSFVLLIFHYKEKPLEKNLILTLLILGNVAVFRSIAGVGHQLRVTILDVGQGDAALIQFPSGKNLLVDGGPKGPTYDSGEKVVLPFLKRTIRKLDALVITHPHSDHLGGIVSIMRGMRVERIFDAGQKANSRLYEEFMQTVRELGIPYAKLRTGDTISLSPEARIYVLHPTKSFVQRDSLHYVRDLNNGSVVLKILYGKVGVLMMGDAEAPSEAQIHSLYGRFLKSDLMKVGHHGSKTSSREAIVESVQPTVAAISVGARNMFGHPSSMVISRYESRGSTVARTDLEGALVFETDGKSLRRVNWR